MKVKTFIYFLPTFLTITFYTFSTLQAREVITKSSEVNPSGVIVETTYVKGEGSDTLAIGDPYKNGRLSARALEGPQVTHAPYPKNCQETRCLRAKKRQLSSPNWKPRR